MLSKTICVVLSLMILVSIPGCSQTDDSVAELSSPGIQVESSQGGEASASDSVSEPLSLTNDEIYDMYIKPVQLTPVIGRQWLSPAELDPDGVMVTLEMLVYEDQSLRDSYEVDGDLLFPQDYAEQYAAQYFGMTPGQLREARYYNAESETYVVPIGLGGAWGTECTGYEETATGLKVYYNNTDGWGYPSAHGELLIGIHPDGSYQYLSNTLVDEIYTVLRFPSAKDFELSDGKATMNSGGISGRGGPDEEDITWYDGEDIENIIAYMEAGLEQAGAVGAAEPDRYEDSWYWEGTYDDGKPLTVDIQPRVGEDDYTITILF